MSAAANPGAKIAFVITLLMAAALSIRLYGIDQPLVRFHATRHYRSAVIARACYYRAASGIPGWSVHVAAANRALQPAGEPPLMEWLACGAYLVRGRETLSIPRALAAIAWVAGAIPLYLLALRAGSSGTALIACALYLFLPYGIVASRNFQPDAVMTLTSLWALMAMIRYHEHPTGRRRYLAIALIAAALLIKPMSIFLTLPVLIGLHIARSNARGRGADRAALATVVLCLIPAAAYYGYSAFFGTLARDQMHLRFVPRLLTTTFFWTGLLTQMQRVFTLPLFAVGLLGVALARPTARVMLVSLWLGYAAFAVAFTYHMPTHDYYHWPYIAVVALGASAVLARLEPFVAGRLSSRGLVTLVTAGCLGIAGLGTWAAWPELQVPAADAVVARYREIGMLVGHDAKVLFLDPEYGYPLMYHGEVSGDAWPNQDDLAAESLGNAPVFDARARFARSYAAFGPRYFVATDLGSLAAQPDLQALLAERTIVVRQTDDYHVYKFVD